MSWCAHQHVLIVVSEPAWIYSRLFYAGLLFFEVANRDFFAFKLIFAPYSEEIEPALLGMSLATLGEVHTVSRSVFRFSRVAVAIISDYLIFQLCSQKTDS